MRLKFDSKNELIYAFLKFKYLNSCIFFSDLAKVNTKINSVKIPFYVPSSKSFLYLYKIYHQNKHIKCHNYKMRTAKGSRCLLYAVKQILLGRNS